MLTAKQVEAAAPGTGGQPRRLSDDKGLYLQVTEKGQRYWRFRYRFEAKQKLLALGVYPEVSLREARAARDDARSLLRRGVDPAAARKAERESQSGAESFEAIAREWIDKSRHAWASTHTDKVIGRLEREVFPWLGRLAPDEITAPKLLEVLRRVEARGHIETAHRTHQAVSRVFRYAIATGRAERDPAADLRGALPPAKTKHHASVTDPRKVGELLRAIEGYSGSFVVACALRLAPLVFVRPGELRFADWSEFALDSETPEWRIPAARMKMSAPHLVPLSTQAVTILRELNPLTGPNGYLFPSMRTRGRVMSENTVNAALRRLGYSKAEATGHGFRSMASTLLNEQGWNRDAIERQLAHAERDKVRAAYNYADYLPDRRRMMQSWAGYLDELRADTGMKTCVEASRTRTT